MPENNRNPRHLIRTLESAGLKAATKSLRAHTLLLGLEIEKEILAERITQRVDTMLEQGFIDEVRSVVNNYGYPPRNFDALGYRIALAYIDGHGEVDQVAIKQAMTTQHRQYAKRQKTWFKHKQDVQWITSEKQADKLTKTFLSKFATIE